MKVGLRVPPCREAGSMAAFAVRAEDAGFDVVWVPDSQLLWRDAYVTLGAMALATERVTLGTAVTNVGTRHPSVLASTVRTVHELANGRFVLGVGAGDSALRPIGERPTAGEELRTKLGTLRTLLAGEDVDFGGGPLHLRDAGGAVPVYLAANGPRNLALAGEVADGVIVLSGASTEALQRSLTHVRAGAESAGRAPDSIDVVVSAFCHVTDDVERDARLLKPICAQIAQTGGTALLALAGISVDVPPRVTEVYPDLVHAEDWGHAVEVSSRWVSDADALAFARTFSLFGTADEIVARLEAVEAAGATAVSVQHVGSYDLPEALLDAFAGEVLPRMATAATR